MLNRHSRKILNFLLKSSPDFGGHIYTFGFIRENYPEDFASVYAALQYLEETGYLKREKPGPASKQNIGVVLTELAMHYHEFVAAKIWNRVLDGIILPIGVALLTTLITLWLTGSL